MPPLSRTRQQYSSLDHLDLCNMRISVIAVEPVVKYSFVEKGIQTQLMGQYKAEMTFYKISDTCDNTTVREKTVIQFVQWSLFFLVSKGHQLFTKICLYNLG